VCCPKHVEQLRNSGIINSVTRLHLVGSFYEMYISMHGSMNIMCMYVCMYVVSNLNRHMEAKHDILFLSLVLHISDCRQIARCSAEV
jgi:hypothetical protein